MSHQIIVPHASSSLYLDEGLSSAVVDDARQKMTCRSPSSASSRSVASSNSTFSSNSTVSSTSSGSVSAEWNLSITSREIYKTGKLTELTEKKAHFWVSLYLWFHVYILTQIKSTVLIVAKCVDRYFRIPRREYDKSFVCMLLTLYMF